MAKRRSKPTQKEKQNGLQGTTQAFDVFTNALARMGFGTPNLAQGANYELVRFSYDYWQLITLYRNHWISRRIVDTPAKDMVRAWPSIASEMDPEDMSKIDRVIRRTYTKANLLKTLQWARLFGGAGALMVIDGHEEILEEPLELDQIGVGAYKGLIPFDRWAGITPSGEVCTDVAKPTDFNKPEFYRVNTGNGESFRVHASRVLRFCGPEVPTPEREAQSWWGISALEPVYEELQKRDNMSWNILSLTFRANLIGMTMDDLAQITSGLGMSQIAKQKWGDRMEAINHMMSNQSLIPLPKDGKLESTSYSFAGLSDCYQQFQLDISGAAEIPVTRLWGRTITGLGQSNDADERIYEERIGSDQETDMRPQLEKLYPVICMSELGEVEDDLELSFPSIRVLDEKEKAEQAKAVVDTVTVALNSGGISPRTYGKELKQSSKITGIFSNITDEDIEKLSDEVQSMGEMAGLFGEEGEEGGSVDLDPSSSPKKVIKESNERKKAADEDGAGEPSHIHGLDIVIETPKGGVRSGKDWKQIMPYDYGYIRGVKGADGDSLDCAVGPNPRSNWVYVFDQRHLPPRLGFDEHKVFFGYDSQRQALDAFRRGHHRASDVCMDFTPMHIDEFHRWMRTADLSKPCSEAAR